MSDRRAHKLFDSLKSGMNVRRSEIPAITTLDDLFDGNVELRLNDPVVSSQRPPGGLCNVVVLHKGADSQLINVGDAQMTGLVLPS